MVVVDVFVEYEVWYEVCDIGVDVYYCVVCEVEYVVGW